MHSARGYRHSSSSHQHVSVDHPARIHYQVAVDDRERPFDGARYVHAAPVGRDLAAEHAPPWDGDPAG